MEFFEDRPTGTLVSIDMDNNPEQPIYHVWFPYTRANMRKIKPGYFVAIKNFSGYYSILEVISSFPTHFALGTGPRETERAFPGFVIEAAKSARHDWEQETSTEQTTKIKTHVVSTNLQLDLKNREYPLLPDDTLPMIGEDARFLTSDFAAKVINRNIGDPLPIISPCGLVHNPEIKINFSIEDLIRTHFGIFGFTGSGKSNLVSNLVFNLLDQQRVVKIVVVDLMGEYGSLLIDCLLETPDASIIAIDMDSLPGNDNVKKIIVNPSNTAILKDASRSISNTSLLPKDLQQKRDKYNKCYEKLLLENKTKVNNPAIRELIAKEVLQKMTDVMSRNTRLSMDDRVIIEEWLNSFIVDPNEVVDGKKIQIINKSGQKFLKDKKIEVETSSTITDKEQSTKEKDETKEPLDKFFKPGNQKDTENTTVKKSTNLTKTLKFSGKTGSKVIYEFLSELNKFSHSREQPAVENSTSQESIVDQLNDENQSSLLIIQGSNDDELRNFSSDLAEALFDKRKSVGKIDPPVIFIFDEADEFIPQQPKDSYSRSTNAIRKLARRGRKFGIGIGIATQRISYLDTSIMAQPHTYFVSKLPREYDRTVISGAFGISDAVLKKSLRFTAGQWLLVSYDALGLVNVPIAVQFPNANDRVSKYLESN
ncbi:MAG: ATP-binding protein [Candidatus Hodarchaeales archaeon]|jgi:hypothetical protein